MERRKVLYGQREITFDLEFKDVKNLNLNIRPDNSIFVSAPMGIERKHVDDFVRRKGHLIVKKMKSFDHTRAVDQTVKEFVSGESYKYLGRQYRLKVLNHQGVNAVELKDKFILMKTKNDASFSQRKNLLRDWLHFKARYIFDEALNHIYPKVKNRVSFKPSVEFKQMSKRWGSCLRSKKKILLNFELIKAPMHCIEYVVLHELLHFKYKNHTKAFYDELSVLMPDWKQRKQILDEEVVLFV